MGDQRIGNYRVVRKLGEGGMGVVYECMHEYIGRRAAVKVLHADFSRNPEMAVRFLNEARATNIVQHPGIVNIFEFDRLPDGSAYIVMDFLDGDSLTTRLQKLGGKMDVQQALIISYQVADALAAAHAKNIVHRDLKPDNIMIVPDASDSTREQAKILDFGIAKIGETAGLGAAVVKTQIGVPMGTPLYMAPEQWKGAADVDAKSDVYSMGIIMFEMMSGQPPFIANSSSEVMALHILATPRLVTELNQQVPEELAFLINSMLAKLPADRPPMIQVVRELRRILGLGIENSLSGMRVSSSMPGGADNSSIRSGGIPAASPSHLRVSGVGQQTASTSGVGPLQLSGISSVGAIAQAPLRTSLPPNSGLRQSIGPGQSGDVPPPGTEPPKPNPNEQWQRRALIGVIGACLIALSALALKFMAKPNKPVQPPQQKFEEGGMVWAEMPSGTTQNLQDVWGPGVNNLWAVGKGGTLLRFQGVQWKDAGANINKDYYLNALWGSGPDDVWAVGKSGIILRWNGAAWTEVPSGSSQPLKDIWGTGKNDVWTVGESGVILHWNGNDWSPVQSGTETELRGIWGSSPKDIWAVGGSDASEGFILHYDGTKWQPHYRAETRLNYLWGSAADDVWAVGGRPGPEGTVVHWDGKEWKPVGIPRAPWLNSIWGSGPRDIWVAGDSGTILHYNGTAWAEAVSATQATFKSVYGTGPNDVWSVAFNGVIRHWNGKTWVPMVSNTQQSLEHVHGSSPTDVWAVGKAGTIVRWDGKAWAASPSGTTNDLHGIGGSGFGNIWTVGDKGTILKWDGTAAWTTVQSGTAFSLNAIYALAPQDMWAVGDRGTILHFDGSAWSPLPNAVTTNLMAVFGVDKNDVWAAGDQGIILHWDGRAWLRVQTDASVTKPIFAIYGSSATDIWASGKQGMLLNWNGRAWVPVQSGTTEDLSAMFGNGRFDVWAVGSGGVILHWNGTVWSKILSKTKQGLHGIWSSRPGDLWVVGQFGLILH
ncbi:MAG: protein kinase [Myxococcales bacterium]|nr:protein kinase [Myxococcales bacterium]